MGCIDYLYARVDSLTSLEYVLRMAGVTKPAREAGSYGYREDCEALWGQGHGFQRRTDRHLISYARNSYVVWMGLFVSFVN